LRRKNTDGGGDVYGEKCGVKLHVRAAKNHVVVLAIRCRSLEVLASLFVLDVDGIVELGAANRLVRRTDAKLTVLALLGNRCLSGDGTDRAPAFWGTVGG
jgi:hypothetical protein